MSWNVFLRSTRLKIAGRSTASLRPQPRPFAGVRMETERLEDRTLPRPELYVEFGDNFPGGVLTDSCGDLTTLKSGNNPAVNGPGLDIGNASDSLTMTSFNSLFGSQAAAARETIMTLIRRYYEPTNVEVVELTATPTPNATGQMVKGGASLADESVLLGSNNSSAHHNDTIVFITGVSVNGQSLASGGLLGISNGTDIDNFNLTEGSALAPINAPTGSPDPSSDPVDLGVTAAHEAGHSFGLQHAYDTTFSNFLGPSFTSYQTSEIMSYLGPIDGLGQANASAEQFSRIPMIAGDSNQNPNVLEGAHGTNSPANQFFADPDVGQNPNLEYVTGSGANDKISILKTGANQATVTVSPFLDASYSTPISIPGTSGKSFSYSYTIGLTKTVLLDGGLGDDTFTIDPNLGVSVRVRGGGGNNTLVISGNGTGSATYTPGTNTTPYFDGTPDFQGTVASGATTITFSEFSSSGAVTIQNVPNVSFTTPGGKDTISVGQTASKSTLIAATVAGSVQALPLEVIGATTLAINSGAGDAPTDNDSVTVDLSNGNPIPSGGMSYQGGVGNDTLTVSSDSNFTLTQNQLTVGSLGSIALSSVAGVNLTGGASPNVFAITDWAGAVTVNGDAKDTAVITADTDFTLSTSKTANFVSGSSGLLVTLNGVTKAQVYGEGGANKFTIQGWSGSVTVDGKNGQDNYILSPGVTGVQITDAGVDSAINTLTLIGTKGNDTFTVAKGSVQINGSAVAIPNNANLQSLTLDGGGGDNTFVVDAGGGLFAGGTVTLDGGTGVNTLTITGGSSSPIQQGRLIRTSSSSGTFVFDPTGSGGPLGLNPLGAGTTLIPFTNFTTVVSLAQVARFDLPFSSGDDDVAVNAGGKVNGTDTVVVTSGGASVRIAGAGQLAFDGLGGSDKFTISVATASAGLSSMTFYGNADPSAGAPADSSTDSFTLLASAVPVALVGQGASNSFVVGAPQSAAGGTDNISSAVTITGGTGTNSLTLSDYGSASGNANVKISATGVSGFVGKNGDVPLSYTGITSLTVLGSNANAAESYTIDSIDIPLSLSTFNGTDSVSVSHVSVPVGVQTGNGNDTVTLTDITTSQPLNIQTGSGNSTIRLTGVNASGGLTVASKGGNNTVTATNSTGAIQVSLGGGTNSVTATGINGPLTIATGAGNDTINVTAANNPVTINAGDGNNTIQVSGNVGSGLTVTAGSGDDAVTLNSVAGALTLNVGDGNNTLILTTVSVPAALALATGSGNDSIQIRGVTAPGGLTVTTGAGNDRVTIGGDQASTTLDTGDGNDSITINDQFAPLTITGSTGDDQITVSGAVIDSGITPLAIDGGSGTNQLAIDDSSVAVNTTYAISATGVSRNGQPPLPFNNIQSYGLIAGSGKNTFAVSGSPVGGISITGGSGGGTFFLLADQLSGKANFTGGSGDDTFLVTAGSGVAASGLTITGGGGNDSLSVTSTQGNDSILYDLKSAGTGTVSGLGGDISVNGIVNVTVDGGSGANALTLLDDSNTSYGTALTPETGIIVRVTGPGSGQIQVGSAPAVVLGYTRFDAGLTINGDPSGSGKTDVVTVLGFSSTGLGSAGPLAAATTTDGSDTISVSDRGVSLTNNTLGQSLQLTLAEANGAPTVSTLQVITGLESTPGGDTVTVTPSSRVNLVVKATGPNGESGSTANRLTVQAYGARSIAALAPDSSHGPTQTRVTIDSTGDSVGYIGFDNAPQPTNRAPLAGTSILAVASGPGTPSVVSVYEPLSGTLLYQIHPFDPSFVGGLSVATGDVNGDGVPDIVIGAGPGGGPHILVVDGATQSIAQSFFAYEPSFQGGVQVAVGDINGDGIDDIILGTGIGGGPRVEVRDGRSGVVISNFFAYESSFRNGVQVSAGDVNGDGVVDIVTGSGVGGGPRVRAFSGRDFSPILDFFAYGPDARAGVNVAVGDVNGDGIADVITGPGATAVPNVRVFSGATGAAIADFSLNTAGDTTTLQPAVRVAARDLNGDGIPDVVTGGGSGSAPVIRGFTLTPNGTGISTSYSLQEIRDFDVFNDGYNFGVFVG